MTTAAAPTPTRSIFYGFGAWVGRLDDRTTCSWWAADPNDIKFDPTKLIKVDLAKNPAAYLRGAITIDQIEVDDTPMDGGLTKIGPTWPTGSWVNSIWLESTIYDSLPDKPEFPQRFMDCEAYALTTLLYWSKKAAPRRFWGLYAQIQAEQGSLALCTVWTPGTSARQPPSGSWWIDLATQADPISNGFTVIGTGSNPKQGALFLDATAFRGFRLMGPKLPPSEGGVTIPRVKR
jgi:hypothetical protein